MATDIFEIADAAKGVVGAAAVWARDADDTPSVWARRRASIAACDHRACPWTDFLAATSTVGASVATLVSAGCETVFTAFAVRSVEVWNVVSKGRETLRARQTEAARGTSTRGDAHVVELELWAAANEHGGRGALAAARGIRAQCR
jgi:hypothetical protein